MNTETNFVSDAELQNFTDELLKSEGENDVFAVLDDLSTNVNKILNELQNTALARHHHETNRLENQLAQNEAELKIYFQQLSQTDNYVNREFSDPALASKSKVKLEAQLVQATKQAVVQSDIIAKQQCLRDLEQKIVENQQQDEQAENKQEMKENLVKLNNELSLYKHIFGLSITPNQQQKGVDALNSFSIHQQVGDKQVLLVPNVKVEQLSAKPLSLTFDGARKLSKKAKGYQKDLIAGC